MNSGMGRSDNRTEAADDVDFAEWRPTQLSGSHSFDVGAINYAKDGFLTIELGERQGSTRNVVDLVFASPLAVRVVGEGSLMSYWRTGFAVKNHNLFVASRSSFLRWLESSSSGAHAVGDVKHFAIFSDDVCVEVLSVEDPALVPTSR